MYRRCTKHVTVVVFFFFLNEKEAIPPGGKNYLGTTKGSTRMILEHVQKMYNIFRLLTGVPDYSSSFFLFCFLKNEEEAIPPGDKKYLGTTKGSTRMILVHVRITVVFFFFLNNEEEAIPPGGKKYLETTKGSTRRILVHVQKMYKTCTEDVQHI